ncbi:uncharacterized protein [Typha latifolia]|uniref:uncharacterized protein isoform X1 n=1 Tax=Typha latifolia TaxID=4733 RepID=UPI003C2D77A8
MESQSHSMITRPSSLSQEDDDAFLGFVDYAISILSSSSSDVDGDDSGGRGGDPPPPPPWSWVTSRILKSCVAYSSGVTAAILLSDLFQAWNEQHKYMTSKKKLELMNLLNTRQRRTRLPNTVTIDSIYEKNFLSLDSVLEVVVIDTFLLPGTNIYMLSLGDMWSSCTIDLYLHRRFYDYVGEHGILKKGREIFLTGCCLRSATEGSGHPRLLPTEYLIILLDEDKDEDAMLLGAQFCTYSFSSISLEEAKNGASYSFYARIRSIESLEPFRSIQRKQISLVDNDDAKIKFLLWGEQVLVANLLSVGSMLALDRPFIANIVDSDNEASQELCLEYGSVTQIYLVPVIQHEEQVILTSTQMRSQGSRLLRVSNESQGLNASQVTLPRDSLGSIDFSKYPFRTYVIDLRDKMTGVSLYVTVTNIFRQEKMLDTVFCVAIEDLTGVAVAKLHFVESWSLGRVGVGHTVYISGLTCSMTSEKLLEVSWFEKESGTSLVNLSCLPALLTSSCLQKIAYLSDVSNLTNTTHICYVHIEQIEHHNVQLLHVPCGCFAKERSDGLVECSFCQCGCNSRCMYSFQLHVTIADESGKVLSWCIGQTAAELLQISPDEFLVLPEDEQAMYLYSLQNEKFKVSLVNSKRHSVGSLASSQENLPEWEITRAQKCE